MKPVHVGLIVFVALLIGGGIGFAIGYQPATAGSPTPPLGVPHVAAANTPGTLQPTRPQAEPTRTDPPRTETPAADAITSPGLADWIASLGHVGPEPGIGRFYGRATTLDGKPLAGVTVYAQAITPRSMSATNDATAAEQVEAYARRTLFSRNGRFSAITDADGRYEVSGLGKYSFRLSAERAGYRLSASTSGTGGWFEPDAQVDFTAEPVCELLLDVRLPDGSQPAEARYSVGIDESNQGGLWRPQSPRIEVKAGTWSIHVTAGKHEQFQSDPISFSANTGAPVELTVQLKSTLGIAVQVEPPHSRIGKKSSPMYSVHLQPDPPDEPPGASARSLRDRQWASEHSIALFSDVKPGRYRVLAAEGLRVVAWQDVTLGSEFLELTIQVPEPSVEDSIVVKVTGPTGEPLPDVRISVDIVSPNLHSGRGTSCVEQGDGVYWVHRLAADDPDTQGDWHYSLLLQSQEYGVLRAEYPRDGTHELHVQFEMPSTLTVSVPGLSTHPKKSQLRTNLWMQQSGGRSWSGAGKESSDDKENPDVLHYSKLTKGRYRFQIKLVEPDDRFGRDEVQLAQVEFDVTAGANAVSCPVPEFHTLTVNVPDPDKTGTVYLGPANDPDRRGRSSRGESKSKLVFEGVTAGQWRIYTRVGEMRVNVAADTEVTLALTKFDCLLLTEIKAGGRIEALGLRDGDRLIRVDGLEWDNIRMFETQVEGSAGRDETTWTVIRNGVPVEVSFRGKDLMKIVEESSNEGGERFKMQPALRN